MFSGHKSNILNQVLTFTVELPSESITIPALAVISLSSVDTEVLTTSVLLPALVNATQLHPFILPHGRDFIQLQFNRDVISCLFYSSLPVLTLMVHFTFSL